MALSNDLISQFVKATKDTEKAKTESTVYGTTVEQNGTTYVQIDGSDILTPVVATADTQPGERVIVTIKNHTAIITGNISSPAARVDDIEDVSDIVDKIAEFEIIIADKVSSDELDAESARIDALVAEDVLIKETLSAAEGDIDNLQARVLTVTDSLTAVEANITKLQTEKLDANIAEITYATITDLEATNADLHNLEATYGDFEVLATNKFDAIEATIDDLDATYATITDLNTERARIDILEAGTLSADSAIIKQLQADVTDIDTLIFGSASGDVIQTSFANAVIAQLGDAQIKSAMIESVSADKITAGDIITNNVRVMSEDGSLIISDETMQISDETRVRVQIGKDAAGDYSINIWDADGNLMFSEGGITDSAIKEAIIRNDMVSDTANIAAHKLDIDSLFEEINGSTNTIKSTRVLLDDQNQTLDVAFTELTTEVSDLGETVTSQGTAISTMQGQISSKIWQQDIDTATSSLSDQYTSVEQTLESLSATVADRTSAIDKKADSTTVTEVSNKVSSLELTVDQFQTSVSETYATKTELSDVNSEVESIETRVSSTETKISQNESSIASLVSRTETIENDYITSATMSSAIDQKADGIMSSVSSTYATLSKLNETNAAVSNLTIGGRNLLLGTKFDGEAKRYERLETYGTEGGFYFDTSEQIESGVEYILSLSIRGNANIVFYEINTSGGNFAHAWIRREQLSEEEFRDFQITFTVDTNRVFGNVYICTQYGDANTAIGDWFEIESCSLKLERGNRKTDWTPAPEDMATDDDVTAIQVSVTDVEEKIVTAETVIQQLSDSIMNLVTDENGETLMVQTETGWTYNMGQLQGVVNATSESLDTLVNDVGDVTSTVDILQQAVNDLGVISEYVKITTYEDEPCIELGEADSDFKLLITNTRILFMEGGVTPAYITNQSLNIEKAVVKEELQQGGFVWKVRSNGNLGLMWKGVDS